ncbi:hypothetical protein AX16_007560 [Volvariella volvacea WC 439]|nr:hypothetical protein AX16_007560 [Volvariella volvacea WC 439]
MRKIFGMYARVFVSGDIDNIVEHYGMKEVVSVDEKGERRSEWVPGGRSAFWVVEAVGGEDAGEIVGCVGLGMLFTSSQTERIRELDCSQKPDVKDETKPEGELRRMIIAPSYRGTGLSRVLLDAVNDHARKAGLTSLHLSTSDLIPAATRLYEKRGWVRERTKYQGNWIFYVKAFGYRLELDVNHGGGVKA